MNPMRFLVFALGVVILLMGSTSVDAQLGPTVLAQIDRFGGKAATPRHGVRILSTGSIERFVEGQESTEIGRLSVTTVQRFKGLTDVLTARSPAGFVTEEGLAVADGPATEYRIRNGEGELLIARRAERNTFLLQGGVSEILTVLDGFLFLATFTPPPNRP
jgi:hypothetical protein